MRRAARYLESKVGTIGPGEFTELQQALGITHHQHALLLDRSLDEIVDPSEAYLHDWQHGLFVDGVVPITVYLLFEEFIQSGKREIYIYIKSSPLTFSFGAGLAGCMLVNCIRYFPARSKTSTERPSTSSAKHLICCL